MSAQDDASQLMGSDFAQLIIESSNDVIIAKTLDGIIVNWNRAASDVYGYTAEEMIGQSMLRLFPPDRIADEAEILRKVRRGEPVVQVDAIRLRKNGQPISVSIQVSPIHDASGALIGASHVERDITARLRADELVRAAVESAPAAVIMAETDGTIVLVNALTEALFGYRRSELIGRPIEDLLPERHRQGHPAMRAAYKAVPTARKMGAGRELYGRHKNGSEIPVEIGLNPVPTSQGLRVLCAVVDISERRRAEEELQRKTEALQESERRFHLAVTGTDAGLWDWDPQTDDVYFSPRFKEIHGYGNEEFPNDTSFHIKVIHPDDLESRTAALDNHLASGGKYDVEYRIKTKSGEYRWINSKGEALRDASGRPYRLVGWIMDITERKRIEQQLLDSRQQLRNLHAHVQELIEIERTRIAREVHDELGQAMTAIKFDVKWLDRKFRNGPSSANAQDLLHRLGEMERVVDQTTATVQRIALELRPGALDHLGLSAAIRDEARRFEARTGIKVALDIPGETDSLDGAIATTAFRICQELLTNVARHSQARTVWVRLDEIGKTLHLDVRDDGIGIPPELAQHITSLGLLGIRERAAQHGGTVAFESQAGRGARAMVRIPTTEKPELEKIDG